MMVQSASGSCSGFGASSSGGGGGSSNSSSREAWRWRRVYW